MSLPRSLPLHVTDSCPQVSAKTALRLSADLPLGRASTVSLQTAACMGGCRPSPVPFKTGIDSPKLLPFIFPQAPTTLGRSLHPFYRVDNAARWAGDNPSAGEP